jgi:hypothetical protein
VKKILGGCLIIVVIAMIGLGVASFYAYRFAKPMIESAGDYLDKARQVSVLADRIANKAPYVPPATGELTQSQVERFVAVQGRVRDELGDRWAEIETKSAEIKQKTAGNHELSFSEVTQVFKDIANIYVEARRVQVNALNIHKFSDAEYTWVRRRVYEAAGVEMASGIDMSAIEDLARDGTQRTNTRLPDIPLPEVPESNIKLVKPHTAKVKEWIPMAVLGL